MSTDILRVESNERVDINDFDFLSTAIGDHQRQIVDQFFCDPARTRKWVLSGFGLSNPAGAQLQVDMGKAILAYRFGSSIQYGVLGTEGDANKITDLAGYANGTYGVYVRFEYVAGDAASRLFWDPAGAGSEFSQTISTRQTANWSVRIEMTNPGDEWMYIGNVSVLTGAITGSNEERNMFFEGNEALSFESGWSSDGGGALNDRHSDRGTYGVTDLQMFTAAMRQSITDLKGRGLREWYDAGIGGMNIGFDAPPDEDRLNVGDIHHFMRVSAGDSFLGWDSDDYFQFYRGSGAEGVLGLVFGGVLGHQWDETAYYPDTALDLGKTVSRWRDLYLNGGNIHILNPAAVADFERWKIQIDVSGTFTLGAFTDNEVDKTHAITIVRDEERINDITLLCNNSGASIDLVSSDGRIGLGGVNTLAHTIQCFGHLIPNSTGETLGSLGTPWNIGHVTDMNVYGNLDVLSGIRCGSGLVVNPADGTGIFEKGISVGVDVEPAVNSIRLGAATAGLSWVATPAIWLKASTGDYIFINGSGSPTIDFYLGSNQKYVFNTSEIAPFVDGGLNVGAFNKRFTRVYGQDLMAHADTPYISMFDATESTVDAKWFRITNIHATDSVHMRFYDDGGSDAVPGSNYGDILSFIRKSAGNRYECELIRAHANFVPVNAGNLDLGASSGTYWQHVYAEGYRADFNFDPGGFSGWVTYTGSVDLSVSSGVGSIKMGSTNSADNAGWLMIYVQTDDYYIPIWADKAP